MSVINIFSSIFYNDFFYDPSSKSSFGSIFGSGSIFYSGIIFESEELFNKHNDFIDDHEY